MSETAIITCGVAAGTAVVRAALTIVTNVFFRPMCRRERGRLIIVPPSENMERSYPGQFIDPC
jgi:hypothetical protein